MKNDQVAPITGAELRVLEELWRRGDSTIGDLRDALYPEGGNTKFATVQKLLSRSSPKSSSTAERRGELGVPSARRRDDLIGGELRRIAGRLGGNSMSPLLTCLVETGELTAKEKAHLRKLLDEGPGAKRRPRS